jgi:hypothetical protein
MLPTGALLLSAGRQAQVVGLCFGALVATLNAGMLVWRIERSTQSPVAQARRVMQQGMGVRFALILMASVVVVKSAPTAIPAFLVGLVVTMALVVAVAARALLRSEGVGTFGSVSGGKYRRRPPPASPVPSVQQVHVQQVQRSTFP